MTGDESLITDTMRARVGMASEPWTNEVDRAAARLFARAVGYTDPMYYDIDAARGRGFRDIPAAPGFFGIPVYDPNKTSAATQINYDEPWQTGRLNGGTEVEYLSPICAGDVIEARRRVISYTQRVSRLGPMVVLREDVEYRREGELVAVEHDTILLLG